MQTFQIVEGLPIGAIPICLDRAGDISFAVVSIDDLLGCITRNLFFLHFSSFFFLDLFNPKPMQKKMFHSSPKFLLLAKGIYMVVNKQLKFKELKSWWQVFLFLFGGFQPHDAGFNNL